MEEADLRFANGELGGVNADGEATGSGGDVIASERALAVLVETAICVERERMRGDDGAVGEEFLNLRLE
jgi:hypothetical protein